MGQSTRCSSSRALARHLACISTLLAVLGLPACQQLSAGAGGATPQKSSAKSALPPHGGIHLEQGMAYADLRRRLLSAGWKPVVDSACTSNVVGSNYESVCNADPNSSACNICKILPELSSCSGDAYCGMHFSNGIEKLHVVAYGDFQDWNVEGEKSQFSVSGWDFSK